MYDVDLPSKMSSHWKAPIYPYVLAFQSKYSVGKISRQNSKITFTNGGAPFQARPVIRRLTQGRSKGRLDLNIPLNTPLILIFHGQKNFRTKKTKKYHHESFINDFGICISGFGVWTDDYLFGKSISSVRCSDMRCHSPFWKRKV